MDRFTAMRIFVTVAEEGHFAAAARSLGMSAPAVTRAVAALEAHLGTPLFKRTTRAVRLTGAGDSFLAGCRRILSELEEAEAAAAGLHSEPRGQLAVTAPLMFGRMYVAPLIFSFLERHPLVSARLFLTDRVTDLIEEGFDVAIRIGHLPDSSLRAVRAGFVRRVVCAAPSYLAERGVPATPADLAGMDAIEFPFSPPAQYWTFPGRGRTRTVRPPVRLSVNTAEAAIAAAVAGRGVARLLSYQIAPELRAGTLVTVLADFEPPPLPIHAVHAEGRNAAARVRAFVDEAVGSLRAEASLALGEVNLPGS